MGLGENIEYLALEFRAETQRTEIQRHVISVQQPHDHALAIHGRHSRDAQVDFLAANAHFKATVLCQAALGDIQVGHDLDARDHGGG